MFVPVCCHHLWADCLENGLILFVSARVTKRNVIRQQASVTTQIVKRKQVRFRFNPVCCHHLWVDCLEIGLILFVPARCTKRNVIGQQISATTQNFQKKRCFSILPVCCHHLWPDCLEILLILFVSTRCTKRNVIGLQISVTTQLFHKKRSFFNSPGLLSPFTGRLPRN